MTIPVADIIYNDNHSVHQPALQTHSTVCNYSVYYTPLKECYSIGFG